ncbi:MAG: DUF6531 domain-containing protein, partial [Betaproteobacteria bacterium]|nr:DUF6531 domain-containing protein [Betaproteobacteria bacterium]
MTTSGSHNVFIGSGFGLPTPPSPVPASHQPRATPKMASAALAGTRDSEPIPASIACLGASTAGSPTTVGHPVHAASGAKILDGSDDTDFALPARLPLGWVRRYSSLNTRIGLLGPGWSTPVCVQLKLDAPGEHPTVFVDEQGREVPFPALKPGQSFTNTVEGLRLCCTAGGHYLLEVDDGSLYYDFGPARQKGPHTLDLLGLEDRNGNAIHLYRDG